MTATLAAADARTPASRPATTIAAATETRSAAASSPPHPALAALLAALYAVVGAIPAGPIWTPLVDSADER